MNLTAIRCHTPASRQTSAFPQARPYFGNVSLSASPALALHDPTFVPKVPPFLYHFTSMAIWDKIQKEGKMVPYTDKKDSALKGIFTVENENLRQNWLSTEGLMGPPHQFVVSGLQRLMDYLIYKLDKDFLFRGFTKGRKGLALLKIKVDPAQDTLFIRDNRFVLGRKTSAKNFRASLKPLSEMTQQEAQDGLLEYILKNEVPIERITLEQEVPKGNIRQCATTREKKRIPAHEWMAMFFPSEAGPQP